jgi:hypothetical protein
VDDDCGYTPPIFQGKVIIDGLMSYKGRFTSCFPSGLIQFLQYKQDQTERYQLVQLTDTAWSIKNLGTNTYFELNPPYFHCSGLAAGARNQFSITFIDQNKISIQLIPIYASAKNPSMGLTTTTFTNDETFWFTSIPYPEIAQTTVLPTKACRNALCTSGVLRFSETGYYVNGNLDACPDEKLLDFFTYGDATNKYLIIGYGSAALEYYIYETPEGILNNLILSQTRYSLFKKIEAVDGTFKLQAWNGKFLGHTLKPNLKIVLMDDDNKMTKFGYN